MDHYLRIARVYLRGQTAAVWCFLFFCLLAVSAGAGELASHQSGILGGILSRKSYMAMFVYFNACVLGVLLRDNLAHPWASVLPQYRQKHLTVTALIALCFLGIPMFSMEFLGTSDVATTSVAVIFLTCLAAGLWTLHHPVVAVLVFPFLVFVMAPASSIPGFAAFLAGTTPATSAAVALISLLALWVLARRLLALKEDRFEYAMARMWGDFFRGRGQIFQGQAQTIAGSLAALPAEQRVALRNYDPLKTPFSNLKQVDKLSEYSARSLWQRLRLWRLGTAPTPTFVTVGWLVLTTLIVIVPSVYFQRLARTENPDREVVVIMSVQVMTNPFGLWFYWFNRLRRLGYESLRPRTRQEFVCELGLTLLWDLIQCWLGGVLCLGIAAVLWAPELLQIKNMLVFISVTGAGQLCVYALMGIWLSKLLKRGMAASVLCAFFPFLAMELWMVWMMSGRIGIEVHFAIASVLAVAGAATIPLAYRRWLRADLD